MRNPMEVLWKSVQMVIISVVIIFAYRPLGNGITGIHNRIGVVYFLASVNAFSSIYGSASTFSLEKPLFLRERFNKSYTVGSISGAKVWLNSPFNYFTPYL